MSYRKLLQHIESRKLTDPGFKVVCRFSPCPNGRPTLGHVKSVGILDEIVRLTKGSLKLRFDDTNPAQIVEHSYALFIDLLETYDIKYDKNIVYCSKQLEVYQSYARILYDQKKVFFCKCRAKLDVKDIQECSCKSFNFKNYSYDECLRKYKNELFTLKYISANEAPYVILRRIDESWYPTIAFQGPIDDYRMGVTLIVRGTDLISLQKRQKEIHRALFETQYPITYYWGRISIWDSRNNKSWLLSKTNSSEKRVIPNLNYFYYWGYLYESIMNFLRSYGFTKNDIKVDLVKLNQMLIGDLSDKSLFQKIDRFQDIGNFYGCQKRYFKFKAKGTSYFGCISKKPIKITSKNKITGFGKRYVFLNYCNNKYYLCPPF